MLSKHGGGNIRYFEGNEGYAWPEYILPLSYPLTIQQFWKEIQKKLQFLGIPGNLLLGCGEMRDVQGLNIFVHCLRFNYFKHPGSRLRDSF